MSILKTINHLYSNSFIKFLKDPSSVLVPYSSSYTPLLSLLSYLIQQQTITSMLMILKFSEHSQPWIYLITSLTLKTRSLLDPTRCLAISFHNPSESEFLIFGLSKLVNFLTSDLFFYSFHIVSLGLLLF